MTDKLKEAIEVLKEAKYICSDKYATDYDKRMNEAIDTVVSHYEKSEKIEFLKSVKQPSEITHPYDLSKKNGGNGMNIEQLIENYIKRLKTLKNMKGLDMIADTRLRTKESCYRTFISELEKVRKEATV